MKAYKNAAIKGGKMVHLGTNLNLKLPTAFTSSFDVPAISGVLNWTNNAGATAQYEVYSSTNAGAYVLLATTTAGATSYQDTTCKQNASVVYKIRAKKVSKFTDFVSATALATPLCWKSDQSVLISHVISTFNITAGKSVTVNYSDGTSQAYSGDNLNITKNFATTGQYNVWLSGDINFITNFRFFSQPTVKGNITNWILPPIILIRLDQNNLSGVASNLIVQAVTSNFWIYGNFNLSGFIPKITDSSFDLNYNVQLCSFSDSNVTVFRKGMNTFNVSNQNVVFSTANIDKLLKAAADWYQVNAPTANCTYNLSGTYMGIPTGGASNTDIARLIGYYTAASKTATVIVRTS